MSGSGVGKRQKFSRRTGWDRTPSDFALVVRNIQSKEFIDLTVANPTACGLALNAARILQPLGAMEAGNYVASPRGSALSREAVAGYYGVRGAHVTPEQMILTSSSSEAYAYLFQLLCDAGDEVLIAQPSYPLFEYLADLADVTLRSYPLFYDHGWWTDWAALERAITNKTRAIVVVDPNNPTGHTMSAAERERLRDVCRRHDLSLIVDEVFLDYSAPGAPRLKSFASQPTDVMTFVLSGLSKVAALPQMKVGWIVGMGEAAELAEAMERLEIIADTFLSVSTPAQLALPRWLEDAPEIQTLIRARIAENLLVIREAGLQVLYSDGGWSAMVRLPRVFEGATAAHALLEAGVLTHPAEFYGLADAGLVVVSLIVPVERMRAGAERINGLFSSAYGAV